MEKSELEKLESIFFQNHFPKTISIENIFFARKMIGTSDGFSREQFASYKEAEIEQMKLLGWVYEGGISRQENCIDLYFSSPIDTSSGAIMEGNKKGKGKRKGSSWEREFCKLLSLWWTKDADKDVFWRSASSGAKATLTGNLSHHIGDVTFLKTDGIPLIDKFCFELKHYADVDLYSLLKESKVRKIDEWWNKLKEEVAPFPDKIPFLIFKIDHKGYFGMLPRSWMQTLHDEKITYFIYKDGVIFYVPLFLNNENVYNVIKKLCSKTI